MKMQLTDWKIAKKLCWSLTVRDKLLPVTITDQSNYVKVAAFY